MAVTGVGGGLSTMLMEKALSNQGKANKLQQLAAPLENAASQQLSAKDAAAGAKTVMAQAAEQAKQTAEATSPAQAGTLNIKA